MKQKETIKSLKERWLNGYFETQRESLFKVFGDGNSKSISKQDWRGISCENFDYPQEFMYTYLTEAILIEVDFSYSELCQNLSNCTFEKVNFTKAKFDQCCLANSKILDSNFTQSKIVASMDDAVLESCTFFKATFGATSSLKEFGGRRTTFENCDFTETNFRKVEFRASKFINCTFESTKFESCDLRGVKFIGEQPEENQLNDCIA